MKDDAMGESRLSIAAVAAAVAVAAAPRRHLGCLSLPYTPYTPYTPAQWEFPNQCLHHNSISIAMNRIPHGPFSS